MILAMEIYFQLWKTIYSIHTISQRIQILSYYWVSIDNQYNTLNSILFNAIIIAYTSSPDMLIRLHRKCIVFPVYLTVMDSIFFIHNVNHGHVNLWTPGDGDHCNDSEYG